MEKYKLSFKQSFLRFPTNAIECLTAFVLIFVIVFVLACAGKKMSVEEAKKVTVAMSEESFVPPPRRIDDILAILEEPGYFEPEAAVKIRIKAGALPPDTNNPVTLANFYRDRSKAAWQIGSYRESLEDGRKALNYAETKTGHKVAEMPADDYAQLLVWLGDCENVNGNFRNGIAFRTRALDLEPGPGRYRRLAGSYIEIGDFKAAEEVTEAGIRLCNKRIRKGAKWGPVYEKHRMLAQLLEAKGQFAEAESHIREMMINSYNAYQAGGRKSPRAYLMDKEKLSKNLEKQGRLLEAEFLARETLKEVIGYAGKESGLTGDVLGRLGSILLNQGRHKDAEKITGAKIRIYEALGMSADSKKIGKARAFLGRILASRGDSAEAMKRFDLVRESLRENQYFYETVVAHNSHLMHSLLKTGRVEEAMRLISPAYNIKKESFGDEDFRTSLLLGLRGVAHAMMNADRQALKDLSVAVPILIEKNRGQFGERLKIIIETYIGLLNKIKGSQLEDEFNINATSESFRLVNAILESSVQEAIWMIGARAVVGDSELRDLVRREQDAFNQINALQETLSNILAAPPDQLNPKAIKDLRAKLNTLDEARSVIFKEIESRFPKYSDLMRPQLVTLKRAQELLKPDEALISIYPGNDYTYVWAFKHRGKVQFAVVPLRKSEINQIVSHMRIALDPDPRTFGDIPEFDLGKAYDLYSKLLKPVEDGWKEAQDLLVVAHGPLGQLPFSVLPTSHVGLAIEKGELFGNYREVPWLIRTVSITRLPSVSSFVSLRTLPEGDPHRKVFVGFGDPLFNQKQLALAEKDDSGRKVMPTNQGRSLHIRGIRVTETGNLDSEIITSSHLELLNRLPDTAEEVESIAKALGADPARDIFLGKRASEHQVKTMNLSDRRVIAFASHALVPGDLDGLDQPALALSSPTVTGEKEDGLLTMGEILKLKLNADWVILSACNTGAAGGAGAEAASGLGRAFFYAGTRAILVSMWPVETTSARKLTSGLFRYQQEDKRLSRARALQKSTLALIDGPGLKDDATSKIIASYAHPLFWAPFIVVGESGSNAN